MSVDDVAFLEVGDKPLTVVNNINARLESVALWSKREGIAFPFEKFRIINLGLKKLPGKYKEMINYGQETPPWSLTAKYLGVMVDHHLHLREHMKLVVSKV